MVYRVTEYDLMKIEIQSGIYYMCTDSRKLYKGMVGNVTQQVSNLTFIAKEHDRLTTTRPSDNMYYYVWDTNSLWYYHSGWQIVDGQGMKSSAYYPVNNSVLTPTDDVTVIDNNGLLGDGSVVVRDFNRIVKGQLYINEKEETNELIISSFLDAGIKLLPNGTIDSAGTLSLSRNKISNIGRLEFYGDIYITKDNGETFNKLASVVDIPTSSSSDGTPGDIAIDNNYFYVCITNNYWKRIPMQTF